VSVVCLASVSAVLVDNDASRENTPCDLFPSECRYKTAAPPLDWHAHAHVGVKMLGSGADEKTLIRFDALNLQGQVDIVAHNRSTQRMECDAMLAARVLLNAKRGKVHKPADLSRTIMCAKIWRVTGNQLGHRVRKRDAGLSETVVFHDADWWPCPQSPASADGHGKGWLRVPAAVT